MRRDAIHMGLLVEPVGNGIEVQNQGPLPDTFEMQAGGPDPGVRPISDGIKGFAC